MDLQKSFSADAEITQVAFSYSMYGANMGEMTLAVSKDCSSPANTKWTTLWTKSGNLGTEWQSARVEAMNTYDTYTCIRFLGTTGAHARGDMAIDDVFVTATDILNDETTNFPTTAPTPGPTPPPKIYRMCAFHEETGHSTDNLLFSYQNQSKANGTYQLLAKHNTQRIYDGFNGSTSQGRDRVRISGSFLYHYKPESMYYLFVTWGGTRPGDTEIRVGRCNTTEGA